MINIKKLKNFKKLYKYPKEMLVNGKGENLKIKFMINQ
jgi:hypothetical protein